MISGKTQWLLRRHQSIAPLPHDFDWNCVGEIKGRGAFLGGIGENADAVEAHLTHEVQQVFEVLVGFAGEADQESRPQCKIRQRLTHLAEEPFVLFHGTAALHGFEQGVIPMLQRHIDIRYHLWQFAQGIDQGLPHHRRIAVEQTQPLNVRDFGQRPQ